MFKAKLIQNLPGGLYIGGWCLLARTLSRGAARVKTGTEKDSKKLRRETREGEGIWVENQRRGSKPMPNLKSHKKVKLKEICPDGGFPEIGWEDRALQSASRVKKRG